MEITIKQTDNMDRKGHSLIVYSDSGKGKTYLLGTLPEKETLIVDIEGGLTSISHKKIDYVPIPEGLPGIKKFKDIHEALRTGSLKYKNVALDSATELERYLQFSLLRERGKTFLQLKEYGDSSQKMREYLRLFRDLTAIGINVIFTALEMPLEIQRGEDELLTKSFPMMSKKLSPEICGYVDMVAKLEVNPKTGDRRLNFTGSDVQIGKSRIAHINQYEPANLTKLFKKIVAGPPKPTPAKVTPDKPAPAKETKPKK